MFVGRRNGDIRAIVTNFFLSVTFRRAFPSPVVKRTAKPTAGNS